MNLKQDLLDLEFYRSKKRIRNLGEVFTPEKYVHQMLDMLDPSVWSHIDTVFFEPTCGHGNFVVAIVQRRLEKLLKNAQKQKIKKPHFYAVANTLNNLWAIDIDSQNIKLCRDRVYFIIFNFLWKHENNSLYQNKLFLNSFIKKNREYLTHVLCCIQYQIYTNEIISCLEKDYYKAQKSANQTLVSKQWFQNHQHRPICFERTWASYFKTCQQRGIVPIEYKRNSKCLEKIIKDYIKDHSKIKVNKKIQHHTNRTKKVAT